MSYDLLGDRESIYPITTTMYSYIYFLKLKTKNQPYTRKTSYEKNK
jgi:hypothetical protein